MSDAEKAQAAIERLQASLDSERAEHQTVCELYQQRVDEAERDGREQRRLAHHNFALYTDVGNQLHKAEQRGMRAIDGGLKLAREVSGWQGLVTLLTLKKCRAILERNEARAEVARQRELLDKFVYEEEHGP